jgi:hypothetical protein
MSKWPYQSDVDKFYGNPRGKNGEANKSWESENIVLMKTPWKLVTSWDVIPVSSIRIHKKCETSLNKIFTNVWKAAKQDQRKINEWGMSL